MLQIMFGQQHNVVASFSQRRDIKRHHVEAVEQVLPEDSVAHGRSEIAIGGRDDSDADPHGRGTAEPLELAGEIKNDADIEEVQYAMGHADISTTKLYDRRRHNPEKAAAYFANY